MSLLQMSLSASIFILAVAFFRTLFIHRIPKMTLIFLWGIALFQLLSPVSVHSQFSIFTAVHNIEKIFTAQEISPITENPSFLNSSTVIMPAIADSTDMLTASQETASGVSPLLLVWFMGCALCALFFIIPHVRYRNNYRMSLPLQSDFVSNWQKSNPIWRKVQIRQSDRIMTPLTYGIIKPVVLLPKNIDYTDEQQLALILTHEFTHIKRLDTLTKWLIAVSVCIHWFNPFVWVMYILANRDIELACDETVIWTFGEKVKPAYAMALVRLEEKKSGLPGGISHFSKNPIEERIISIMKTRKIPIPMLLLAVVIAAGIVTVFATSAHDKTEAAQEFDNPVAESAPAAYQGETSISLMPLDLTFSKLDVPDLIGSLASSRYRAVYIDSDINLRVMNDNSIQISKHDGAAWTNYDTEVVEAQEFADWIQKNDPNPGYSMKELQSRLANGAEVQHLVLEHGKEMYFIIDGSGVQIELVQPERIASVLIDGQRMMITSVNLPMHISAQMLHSFYDLLVSSNILTNAQAEQDYSARMKQLDMNFTVTE